MSTQHTAFDTVLAAIRSGVAGPLKSRDLPTAASPLTASIQLADLIVGYGSPASKAQLANAVALFLDQNDTLTIYDLHEDSKLDDVVTLVSQRLSLMPPAFRCTYPTRIHDLRKLGTGFCPFDGSPIVHV